MLILSRREGEKIAVGNEVVVTVLGVTRGRVRIGIDAPPRVHVMRTELLDDCALDCSLDDIPMLAGTTH